MFNFFKKKTPVQSFREELERWGIDTSQYTDEQIEAMVMGISAAMYNMGVSVQEAAKGIKKIGEAMVEASEITLKK